MHLDDNESNYKKISLKLSIFAITVHGFVPVHSPSVAAHSQILPEPLLSSQELGDAAKP